MAMLFFASRAMGQELEETQPEMAPQTYITDSYETLVKQSSSWENFKVIPIAKVQAFGKQLQDSTSQYQETIDDLSLQIVSQKAIIDSSNINISALETSLEESERTNNAISFMGFSFSKNGYHIFVWLIICALLLIIIVTYMLYLRSNSLTRQYKKDLEQVKKELETQRSKAHENQVKLKRELQTLMNLMSEKGVKF